VDGLQRLTELAPVEHGTALAVGPHPIEQRPQPMDGVAPHPGPGRVGALADQGDLDPQRPLAARLHHGTGGLTEHGGVTVEQVGTGGSQCQQPVVLVGDLLAGVEHVGDVHRGLADGGRQLKEDGQPPLHVGRAQAPQAIAFEPGPLVAIGRHRVEVPDEQQAPPTAQRGTGNHVVADSVDGEPGHRPQLGLHDIGQGRLLPAHRRDVDEVGAAAEQVGHRPLGLTGPSRARAGSTPA
jgi:hypothetical protein